MKRLILTICMLIVVTSGFALQTPVHAQTNACAKAPAPHLKKGDQVQIMQPSNKDLGLAYLKADAGRAAPVLRYLPIGTVVEVVDGPKCGDDKGYWWQVKLSDLMGWMAEAADKAYALEPASGPSSTPPPSTTVQVLPCIQPIPPSAASGDIPDSDKVTRVVFSTLDGTLQVSDNGGIGRPLTTFNPPPLSVDLSPDGTAALVVTYNGLYWVDIAKGSTVLIADATTFALPEGAWPDQAIWLPDGRSAALEITDKHENVVGYAVWNVGLDGSHAPFRVDTGAQGPGGIERSPFGQQVLLVSANDISSFPKDANESTDPLLEYIPKTSDSDPTQFVAPALAWADDGKGFYTFIPLSEAAGPDEKVGGHLWFVSLGNDPAKDLGKLTKVKPTDYVIASPKGNAVLLGRGASWAIQNPKSSTILQALPPTQFVFGWTPDGLGVVYTNKAAEVKYMGIDGSTSSAFVPDGVTDLFDIKWLPDGTIFYVIRGKDGKLSFKVKRPGDQDKFLGIISTINAYSGWVVSSKTAAAMVPSACK